jgi:hypothetical protein
MTKKILTLEELLDLKPYTNCPSVKELETQLVLLGGQRDQFGLLYFPITVDQPIQEIHVDKMLTDFSYLGLDNADDIGVEHDGNKQFKIYPARRRTDLQDPEVIEGSKEDGIEEFFREENLLYIYTLEDIIWMIGNQDQVYALEEIKLFSKNDWSTIEKAKEHLSVAWFYNYPYKSDIKLMREIYSEDEMQAITEDIVLAKLAA